MKSKKIKKKEVKLVDCTKIRFSPEIEVEFPDSKDSNKLIERNRVLKGWELDMDGSLDNGAEYRPKNSNHLYYNEESLMQIKEILALIKVHKGKVKSNCGLHIHCDMSKFNDKQVLSIIKEFIHRQKYIIKRFKINPKRVESMCALLPVEGLNKISIAEIHRFRNSDKDWSSKYYKYFEDKFYSLNVQHLAKDDYGTLEFRIFEATLNYKELTNCIEWTLKFVRDSLERD